MWQLKEIVKSIKELNHKGSILVISGASHILGNSESKYSVGEKKIVEKGALYYVLKKLSK